MQLKQGIQKIVPATDSRSSIPPLDFVTHLIFCHVSDTKKPCLESIRRSMKLQFNTHISRSAFWERLTTKRLHNWLQLLVESLMGTLTCSALGGDKWALKLGVTKIWVIDSCSFTLWDGAKEDYPGTRMSAGIKWHACFDLVCGKLVWSQLTPTSTNDSQCFPHLSNIKGGLAIFDLGYWDFSLLWNIKAAGGFFLSRIKSNAVVTITEVIQGMAPKKYIGQSLLSIKHRRKKKDIIEVMIEKMCSNDQKLTCRAMGFWNPTEKVYHWYLTNLSVNARLIYPLYRFRWQIELIFKSCKQSMNASRLTSNNSNIIESLLLATIVSKLASQTILQIALPHLSQAEQWAISYQRIAKVAVQLQTYFIPFLLHNRSRYLTELIDKIKLFSNEIFDPNHQHRKTTLAQINSMLNDVL